MICLGHSPIHQTSIAKWWQDTALLSFDYFNNRYIVDENNVSLIATHDITRASDGYFDNTAGLWSVFGNDIIRRTNRGLLVEPEKEYFRTNSAFEGAVIGGSVPDGWNIYSISPATYEIIDLGEEDGLPYIDIRYVGIPNNDPQINLGLSTAMPVSLSDKVVSSVFCRIVSGSMDAVDAIEMRTVETDNGTYKGATSGVIDVSKPSLGQSRSELARTIVLADTTHASTRLRLRCDNINPIDITLRIAVPQLEFGGHATAPVLTTSTSTVIRPKDLIRTDAIATTLAALVRGILVIKLNFTYADPYEFARFFAMESASGQHFHFKKLYNEIVVQFETDAGSTTLNFGSPGEGDITLVLGFDENGTSALVTGSAIQSTDKILPAYLTVHTGADEDGNVTASSIFHEIVILDEEPTNARIEALSIL